MQGVHPTVDDAPSWTLIMENHRDEITPARAVKIACDNARAGGDGLLLKVGCSDVQSGEAS